MFYNNHNCMFKIKHVYHVKRKSENCVENGRMYSALGLRLKGKAEFKTKNSKLTAKENSIIYIPANYPYSRKSQNEELLIIHLDVVGEEEKEIQIIPPEYTKEIIHYFFDIKEMWEKRKAGYEHLCTSALYKIFGKLEHNSFDADEEKAVSVIKNSISYMNTHFTKSDLTIGEIASASFISEVYFRKLYKRIYGISPKNALQEMRLSHACTLLESGYYKVNEIAEKSGFDNTQYFSTLFKNKVGKTPSEYMDKKDKP